MGFFCGDPPFVVLCCDARVFFLFEICILHKYLLFKKRRLGNIRIVVYIQYIARLLYRMAITLPREISVDIYSGRHEWGWVPIDI